MAVVSMSPGEAESALGEVLVKGNQVAIATFGRLKMGLFVYPGQVAVAGSRFAQAGAGQTRWLKMSVRDAIQIINSAAIQL